MKKTLLISTVFFLSAASFAQTRVNNNEALKGRTSIQHDDDGTKVNSSSNASSATTIHPAIVQNETDRSTAKIKEEHQAMKAQKKALAAEAKTKGQQTANTVSEGHSASANSKVKVDATTSEENTLNENSSLEGDENVSASSDKNQVGKLKSAEKENFHATLKGDNRSEVAVEKMAAKSDHKINGASAAKVNAAASAAHSLRVKPLSVKAGAHVRTNAGIRFR